MPATLDLEIQSNILFIKVDYGAHVSKATLRYRTKVQKIKLLPNFAKSPSRVSNQIIDVGGKNRLM